MEKAYIRNPRSFSGHINFFFDKFRYDLKSVSGVSTDDSSLTNPDLYQPHQQRTSYYQHLRNINSSQTGYLFHQNASDINRTSMEAPAAEASFERIFKEAQLSIIVLYTVLCVVAVLGNSVVVYVVVSRRRMRNVTNYFIASLAVSDVLMAVFCIPFSFVANVLFNHWPFGAALCPIVTYIQVAVVFQNSYTMLAMSLERYIAIMYPFLRRLGKTRCLQVLAACWVLAFLTPIPTAVTSRMLGNVNKRNETLYVCHEKWSTEQQRFSYSLTIMFLQYFVPLAVLIYTYAKIVHIIWLKDMPAPVELLHQNEADAKPKEKESDPRKKVIKMMITVVGIYGVCWLPLHLITIAGDMDVSIFRPAYMRVVWIIAHWLSMSSCAYNPFIYFWMNPKFREGYISLFRNLRSVLCFMCRDRNEVKESAASIESRRYFLKFRNGSRNTIMSQRMSGTQMVDLTGTFCEGIRKYDTVLLVDHHDDKMVAREVEFVPELSKISEGTDNVTNAYDGRSSYQNNEKSTDLST